MTDPRTARVVVVSWNGAALLSECLDSLEKQTLRPHLEVVVVDNASTDGTDALLATHYPWVRVIRSDRNLGFAGGAALGMADADGDVVLLNNDATFAADAVEQLLAALRPPTAERVGATTALVLLRGDGGTPALVNSTGNVVARNGAGGDRDWLAPVGSQSHDPEVFGFNGGACALRREALDEVGGFDPWLFLYYEDTELSWRLRAHGWTVRYVESAVAIHRHAASSGADSPLFRYYNTRNSLVVITRHAPVRTILRSATRQTMGCLRSGMAAGWRDPTTRARARALRAWVGRLRRTLHERRSLWADAVVSRRTVADAAWRR